MAAGGKASKTEKKGNVASASTAETQSTKGPFKLEGYKTEDLIQLAKSYGLPDSDKREELLSALNPYADGILDKLRPANLSLEVPKFNLKTLRDAIPNHCFQKSYVKSFSHLFSDLAIIGALFYLATWISSPILPAWSKFLLWPLYWAAQGSVMTGLWVLAHECGHQAFTESEFVNNLVGTICHSALLVPYHSWRITHAKHHSNTGSTDNDEVFCPATRSDIAKEVLRDTPLANLIGIVLMMLFGWPMYLVFNSTGPAKYRGMNANHFSPTAAFFTADDYSIIVQSVSAWLVAVAVLFKFIFDYGLATVTAFYIIPYLIVNYHLVLITYLQHTDVFVPHFRGKEWSWLRGALCTVDRSFGPLLDHTFHHIVDTHVCHHLFSNMPFYHAQEATQHIRKVLGSKYYLQDETPIWHALYRSFSTCLFIEDEGGIVFYKNMK